MLQQTTSLVQQVSELEVTESLSFRANVLFRMGSSVNLRKGGIKFND